VLSTPPHDLTVLPRRETGLKVFTKVIKKILDFHIHSQRSIRPVSLSWGKRLLHSLDPHIVYVEWTSRTRVEAGDSEEAGIGTR
jgi:hypothetical protein